MTTHQTAALAHIAANPGAYVDTKAVGVRTARALAAMGFVTVTGSVKTVSVQNSGFARYGAGHHSRMEVEITATVTDAGRAAATR